MSEKQEPLTLVPEEKHSQTNANKEGEDRNHDRTNGIGGGESEATPHTHTFDPDFTQSVINATGPRASPRMRKVMASLIRHVHDFARENELTVDEWMAVVEMVCPSNTFHCSPADASQCDILLPLWCEFGRNLAVPYFDTAFV